MQGVVEGIPPRGRAVTLAIDAVFHDGRALQIFGPGKPIRVDVLMKTRRRHHAVRDERSARNVEYGQVVPDNVVEFRCNRLEKMKVNGGGPTEELDNLRCDPEVVPEHALPNVWLLSYQERVVHSEYFTRGGAQEVLQMAITDG